MNLPAAPPAFDASDRTRVDTGPDVGAAIGLVLAEVLVVAGIAAAWIATGFTFDTATAAEFDRLGGYLAAAAAVGGFAMLASGAAFRTRAPVTAWSQAVMVVLIAFGVLGGLSCQRHEDEVRETASVSTGPVGCRGGGDSDACASLGG
ncbi:DUF6234 family protein [Streptomyces sp. PmtG]